MKTKKVTDFDRNGKCIRYVDAFATGSTWKTVAYPVRNNVMGGRRQMTLPETDENLRKRREPVSSRSLGGFGLRKILINSRSPDPSGNDVTTA